MIKIDSKTTIQELMEHYPRATAAFIKRRLLCVGSPAQAFHAMEDVSRNHGSTIDGLCAAIREAIQTD
jgi:hybrid cluster-associated redox disulfide protein